MRVAGLILALVVTSPVSGTDLPADADYQLSDLARKAIEKVGCLEPFGVSAAAMEGKQNTLWQVHPVYAIVTCEDHVVTPGYRAFYRRFCGTHNFRWRCGEPELWLRWKFMDRATYVVELRKLTLEAGLVAMKCLERGLEQHDPYRLRFVGEPRGLWVATNRATGEKVTEAYLLNDRHDCVLLHVPLECDLNGDVPVTYAKLGCD